MFEPGMRLFEVQFRRNGQEVGVGILHARDEADAIARAWAVNDEISNADWPVRNPRDEPEGLEARVGAIVDPSDHTQTVFGKWAPVSRRLPPI